MKKYFLLINEKVGANAARTRIGNSYKTRQEAEQEAEFLLKNGDVWIQSIDVCQNLMGFALSSNIVIDDREGELKCPTA